MNALLRKCLPVLLLFGMLFFPAGCDRETALSDMDLSHIFYGGHEPSAESHSTQAVGALAANAGILRDYSFRSMADILYVVAPGDSLKVTILEFENDMFALGFLLNSGLFQEKGPVIKGDAVEQSLRAGKRLFLFRHSRLRRHDRGLLEKFVQKFPGYRAGLPQEFLSLPFRDRQAGETSIQTRLFHGVSVAFPVLVQRYAAENLYWNIARSWSYVSEGDWDAWVNGLRGAGKSVILEANAILFNAGHGERAMATRLPGGRVVCVWGPLDDAGLRERFEEARQSVYDAKF